MAGRSNAWDGAATCADYESQYSGPDVFLISPKGLVDVSNRAVAVLFDMVQDLICKPLPNSWQLLFLVAK